MVPLTGPDLTLNHSHLNRSHLNRSHLGGVYLPVGPVYGTNCLHKRLQKSLLYVSVGSGSLVLTPVNMKQGGFPKKGTFFARLPLQPMRMCRNGPPRKLTMLHAVAVAAWCSLRTGRWQNAPGALAAHPCPPVAWTPGQRPLT